MSFEIIEYEIVDTTLELAKNLKDVKEFTTIVAKRQLRGRGRFGRVWSSPVGGLWFTTILYPRTPAQTYSILPLLSSLSVSKAIEGLTTLKTEIRWPNDVYVNGKKLSGILIESEISNSFIERAFVGIGVNTNFRIDALPIELRDKATTVLEEIGRAIDNNALLFMILKHLKEFYLKYRGGLYREILSEVERMMSIVERKVSIYLKSGKVDAVVKGFDIYGNIKVEVENETLTLTPSEVEKLEIKE